jgi:antitoxin (DNA-binding transcriptional repressor) of toxin-antitoxin stability system
MRVVTVHKAKSDLAKLVEQACLGEEIFISRGATTMLRLVPVGTICRQRQPGALRGRLYVDPEFFEPLPANERSPWG